MIRLWLFLGLTTALVAADESLTQPSNRLAANAAEWLEIAATFAQQPETRALFEERRFFAFRREPVVLRGEVRVSQTRGLSLYYAEPEKRTVIIDEQGMLWRDAAGKDSPPPDSRANMANEALRHILRLDLAALETEFEIFGRREGTRWWLGLTPRTAVARRMIGEIFVDGVEARVQRIELRRSAKQRIEIMMSEIRPTNFSAEEQKRYFR